MAQTTRETALAGDVNPAAPHVLPFFVPGPDGSDQMMVTTAIVMAIGVIVLGVIFFTIHSLPERMAHRTKKVQMEIVAVLCLLALLTQIHSFWIGALLLALIDIPSLARPVERIAGSLERIAGQGPQDPPAPPQEGAAGAEADSAAPARDPARQEV
jgi:hypothetical protein